MSDSSTGDALQTLTNRLFDEIAVGDTASTERTLTDKDIRLFALLAGGLNPKQTDSATTGSAEPLQGVIASGTWGSALISGVLGTRLPGPGTVYCSQSLRFMGPVRVGDTLRVTVTVVERDPARKRLRMDCECTNQRGDVIIDGEAQVQAPTERIALQRDSIPDIRIDMPKDQGLKRLLDHVRTLGPLRVAVVHPCDAVSLGAAIDAREAGLIDPVIVAPRAKLTAIASDAGLDLAGLTIEDVPHSHAAAAAGARLAGEGAVQAIMKGSLHTDELMSAVLASAAGLRTERRVSHCFIMQTPAYPRPFIITDAAINIAPDLNAKADIIRNAIELAHAIGIVQPRVAILAAVETVNAQMPATLDAAALCKMADRGQITGALLDGPLAFDNAVSPAAAHVKGIVSEVAGQADILVVPDLESGNMLAKQLEYMGHAASAGIVLGTKLPIILTSRADSRETRLASCAVAVLLAAHYKESPP
ncbi:Phosphate acetyl/butaryl transferase [Bordetella sputigena]|uniref:bifunctional enoyl-CoA hydratase/phosphate acetyltransferase n=1 Tax=Bordetella sputigena TaxID=1416810 RepID=UPI0039F0420E